MRSPTHPSDTGGPPEAASVATLSFSVPYDFDTIFPLATTRRLEIDFSADATFDPPAPCALVLDSIRQSEILRVVHYEVESGVSMHHWIDAVASNHHVEEFEIRCEETDDDATMGIDAVARLLRTTTSISKLRFSMFDNVHVSDVCDALRTNATLVSLYMDNLTPHNGIPVLTSLQGHESIQSLGLGLCSDNLGRDATSYRLLDAISALLQSNTLVTDLTVGYGMFTATGVQQLLDGLYTNRSVSKLTLTQCYFQCLAATAFVDYMVKKNGIGRRRIQSLSMDWWRLWDPPAEPSDTQNDPMERDEQEHEFSLLLGRLLQRPRGHGVTSAQLSLTRFNSFWASLEEHATCQSPMLLHLDIVQHNRDDLMAGIRQVPNLLYLRTLQWTMTPSLAARANRYQLLECFRKNGSLWSVDFTSNTELTAHEQRLLEAWGLRNRHLPELLQNCRTASGIRSIASESNDNSPICHGATNHSLVPTLFWVAHTTPRMTLQHLFHGVVVLSDALSHQRDSIRTPPESLG